jgi:hypothetical protein
MRAPLLLLAVLLLLLLQAIELWRRAREPEIVTARQFWRRLLTAGLLQLVLLMWLLGERLMRGQAPLTQLAYWSGALFLAVGAAFSAVREMGEVSRQYNRQRVDLLRRSDLPPPGEADPLRGGDRATG